MNTQKNKETKKLKHSKNFIKRRVLSDGTIEITRYAHPWEYKYHDPEDLYSEETSDDYTNRERES